MANRLSQGMPKFWQRRLAALATKSTASASSLSNCATPSSPALAVRNCSMLARNTCRQQPPAVRVCSTLARAPAGAAVLWGCVSAAKRTLDSWLPRQAQRGVQLGLAHKLDPVQVPSKGSGRCTCSRRRSSLQTRAHAAEACAPGRSPAGSRPGGSPAPGAARGWPRRPDSLNGHFGRRPAHDACAAPGSGGARWPSCQHPLPGCRPAAAAWARSCP